MSIDPALRQRIDTLLSDHRIVLFMKGSPGAPQCGFSAKAAGILSALGQDYASVDVLVDPEIRDGIKAYGNWPTIPQLYVGGELVGGSDIIEQLLNSGELHQLLGLPEPDRTPPRITISEAAAKAISAALQANDPELALHLAVGPDFDARFELRPVSGGEIVAEDKGIVVHLDLASAARANGLQIDWVEDVRGAGLAVRNPNAPPPVQPLSVQALAERIAADSIRVIDVRPAAERALAPFPGPHEVLDAGSHDRLLDLPADTPLAFVCHHGNSSRQAAEHFRQQGFSAVFNLEGGIDAWSREIDPGVPRY